MSINIPQIVELSPFWEGIMNKQKADKMHKPSCPFFSTLSIILMKSDVMSKTTAANCVCCFYQLLQIHTESETVCLKPEIVFACPCQKFTFQGSRFTL